MNKICKKNVGLQCTFFFSRHICLFSTSIFFHSLLSVLNVLKLSLSLSLSLSLVVDFHDINNTR